MPGSCLIRGARLEEGGPGAVRISQGYIVQIAPDLRPQKHEVVLDLDGMFLLPGLINAHDHLNLDLLPPLGNPPYPNSHAWHEDLVRHLPVAALEHRPVSEHDRILWGAYRNLFSGVTTVAHHGYLPLHMHLRSQLPIRLRLPMAWAESVRDIRKVRLRAREARGRMPFVIHVAEGVDEVAASELLSLEELDALGPGTVLVHGVALRGAALKRVAAKGASLVWCPRSNHFLFGETARVHELPPSVPVALATDSTMTGSATLFDEARFAMSLGLVDAERILEMVTSEAARVLMLPEYGRIEVGRRGDLIALPAAGTAAETLLAGRPGSLALVLIDGRVALSSRRYGGSAGLDAITVDGQQLYVRRGVSALLDRIRRTLPTSFTSPTLDLVA